MAAIYEIYKDAHGHFRFWLIAGNGTRLLTSKTYATKRDCRKAIKSAKKSASFSNRIERKEGRDSKSYFVLKAGNHRPIGRSEAFASKDRMDGAIEIVRKDGPRSPVNDLSANWH